MLTQIYHEDHVVYVLCRRCPECCANEDGYYTLSTGSNREAVRVVELITERLQSWFLCMQKTIMENACISSDSDTEEEGDNN
jgi:Fe-S-cluster containining protein